MKKKNKHVRTSLVHMKELFFVLIHNLLLSTDILVTLWIGVLGTIELLRSPSASPHSNKSLSGHRSEIFLLLCYWE